MATLPFTSVPTIFSSVKKKPYSFPSNSLKHGYIRNSYNHNPSRRLALIQLGTAIPQSQLLGANAAKLLRAEESKITSAMNEQDASNWIKNDNRRMLHVVYRVGDLEKTIKFYTECLGMKLLRQRDIPAERYSNAFLGYGDEKNYFPVELTYNYGVDKYNIGNAFGHFGIGVEDVSKTVDQIKAKGGKIKRGAALFQGGNTIIASIEDPDGYTFALVEKKTIHDPFGQLMLRVGDLDRSIDFHKKAYGMELLRKEDYPEHKYATAVMGYGPEDKGTVLELTYNYGVTEYDKGTGYAQIAIGTDDVYKTAEAIKLYGGKIIKEPGPVKGINTKVTACVDPDGWKTVFVDNRDFLKELE